MKQWIPILFFLLAVPFVARAQTCAVSITSPANEASESGVFNITLAESAGCPSPAYQQVYVSGSGTAWPYRFTGLTTSFNTAWVPSEAIQLQATVWSDPNYVNGPAATSSVVTFNALPAGTITPRTAASVLGTMGADTHLIQSGESENAITNGLRYTGLHNIREDATHNTSLIAELCAIHAATGVMVDELPIVDSDPNNIADTQAEYEQLAACGAMLAAEGPNEPNNFNFKYLGNKCQPVTNGGPGPSWACAEYQRDLYAMVHGDSKLAGMQVFAQTNPGAQGENMGLQFLAIPTGNYPFPQGTQYADYANVHNYMAGSGSSSSGVIDNQAFWAESISRGGPDAGAWDLCNEFWGATWFQGFSAAIACEAVNNAAQTYDPMVTTETNYFPNSAVNTTLQGKMVTDLYLQAVNENFSYTFVYPMFNDSTTGDNGGFFNVNGDEGDAGNATPLGVYTHNLTSILADGGGSFSPTPVNYTITGLPSTGYSVIMQKSSGRYELAIWGEAFASETSANVTVSWPSAHSSVNVYDVTSGTSPVNTYANVANVTLPITDHVMIVEF